MKNNIRYWLYPVVSVVIGVACYLILFFAVHLDAVYAVFYSIFASGVAFGVARLILHVIAKDKSDSFKATMVWLSIALGLFLWLILNPYSWMQTVLVFAIMTAVLNYFGFRFIAKPEDVISSIAVETRKEKIERLAREMKYELAEDGTTPLLDKPLCLVDGVALTPKEADELGYGAVYANAIEYIKKIVK